MKLQENKKYYIVCQSRRIGFIKNGICHDKKGFAYAEIDEKGINEEFTVDEDDKLTRNKDGYQFEIIAEDSSEFSKTQYARGGDI